MVSRPIVAAPIVGYLLGDAITGLLIGGVLELLWIGEIPIGGHIPAHEVMLTVIITAVSLMGQKALNEIGFDMLGIYGANILFVLGFTVLIALPMDMICKKADGAARVFNARFFHAASAALEKDFVHGVVIHNLNGIGIFFVLNFLTLFGLTFSGALLIYLLPHLPQMVVMALPLACSAVFLTGLSSAYTALYRNWLSTALFAAAAFFSAAVILVMIG